MNDVINPLPDTQGWEVNIMGIDPGGNVGVTIMTLDFHTRKILRTQAISLNIMKSEFFNRQSANTTSDSEERLLATAIELRELLWLYRPVHVYCESPFFRAATATAFASLTRLIQVIKNVLREFNDAIPFYLIDPPRAKKAVGAKGNAKKDEMTIAIEKLRPTISLETLTEDLTEHSVDSTAICYWGYTTHAKLEKPL